MAIYTNPGLGWWSGLRKYGLYSPDDALVVGNIFIESFFVFYCETYTKYFPRKVFSTMFHLPPSSMSIKYSNRSRRLSNRKNRKTQDMSIKVEKYIGKS